MFSGDYDYVFTFLTLPALCLCGTLTYCLCRWLVYKLHPRCPHREKVENST